MAIDSPPLKDTLSKLRGDWGDLAARVRDWEPTVVILVARKSPRVMQALGLSFPPSVLVVSDLAIPFVRDLLDGARVAVVDDVVNRGSTIRNVVANLDEVEALRIFAVGRVAEQTEIDDLECEYVYPTPLERADSKDLARRVPDALQTLAKPYDLDFPLLPCQLEVPLAGYADLYDAMVDAYGEAQVWDVTTPLGAASGVRRLVVDLADDEGGHCKARIYFDERAGTFNLMPIYIQDELPFDAPNGDWQPAPLLWESLAPSIEPDSIDQLARLRLFADALKLGARLLRKHADLMRPTSPSLFCPEDAELVFGPGIHRVARRISAVEAVSSVLPARATTTPMECSPFAVAAREHKFTDDIVRRAGHRDILSLFLATFQELAASTGNRRPSDYRWEWPFDRERVIEDPYLRLRIGPTCADLVTIIHDALGGASSWTAVRRGVTRLLDHYIDAGSVVPAIAVYPTAVGRRPFRVYRSGENEQRVAFADDVDYAVTNYARAISRTRVTKVITALAFTEGESPLVEVAPLERGNALCFRPELLDDSADVTAWMRETGRRVSKDPSAS